MSACSICGRTLTNPSSIARGVGPVCGGRSYQSRVMGRYGAKGYGWSEIEEWEKVNNPCWGCKHFEYPGKTEGNTETEIKSGFKVTMHGLTEEFHDKNAMGGYCKIYRQLIDGNKPSRESVCEGAFFETNKENQPKIGLMHRKDKQISMFNLDTGEQLLSLLLFLLLVSCGPSKEKETYKSGKGTSIEIVKVRNCEYVLWYTSGGGDMEHYAGCKNPDHCKK